jgi:hypothetical protein
MSHEPTGQRNDGDPSKQVPHWDSKLRHLRWNGCLIKEFQEPAANQETILAAFEEEGWPPHIDDPLPQSPEIDPKRRLQDAIKRLNRSQVHRLIKFRSDANGSGIGWELATTNSR